MAHSALPLLDRCMLHRLLAFSATARAAYEEHNFGALYRAANAFLSTEVLAFYFELGKDRLYIRAADDAARRTYQTVLTRLLRVVLATMAPITPHMCEGVWRKAPRAAF
jgi:isoleucyl-tRNA synthetase